MSFAKIKATALCLALSSLSALSYGIEQINSANAAFHLGKSVVACGVVKEVKRFKRGIYLNMDKPFPQQSLTLVAWEDDLQMFQEKFGNLELLKDRRVCGQGVVNQYRGANQISLKNAFSLKTQ